MQLRRLGRRGATHERPGAARRRLLRVGAVGVLVAGVIGGGGPAFADGSQGTCSNVFIPVNIGLIGSASIYGEYCTAAGGAERPLQILVPGITYTHVYFDMPGFGGRYSYVKFMNARGYDTLAIDRLGMGQSTRPLIAATVNAYSNAEALHQVVQYVRAGNLARSYDSVVLTGHSYGTFVSDLESATYHDVDGIIGTGWLQEPTAVGLAGVLSILTPADLYPKFAGVIDPTYVTTTPGDRGFFYAPGDTDPAVVAADEQTKDTASLAEVTYLIPENLGGLTERIGVPTLRVVGSRDRIMCLADSCSPANLAKTLPPLFPSGVDIYVQEGAGHDVALEENNTGGFDAMLSWLKSGFPQ
jgi:pimeloyl-ACP methyl ester carboxylesterase